MSPDIMAAEFFDIERINDRESVTNPVHAKYMTKDGRWIQLSFLQPGRHWRAFANRIGRPDLAEDPRFISASHLLMNSKKAESELKRPFASNDHAYWTELLRGEEGVWATISSPREVLRDK